MTDRTLPPPTTPSESSASAGADLIDPRMPGRSARVVFAIAAAVAIALATVTGTTVGFMAAAASAASCSPSDGWCDLGAALVGIAAGMLVGAITYVVAGVITIQRLRPKGQRAGLIRAHLAAPFAVGAGLVVLSLLAGIVQ